MGRPPTTAPRTTALLIVLVAAALGACGDSRPLALLPVPPPLDPDDLQPGPALLERPEHCPASMQRIADQHVDACMDRFPQPGWDTRPVETPSIHEARSWCSELGLRLCTEREWELGCRGRTGSRYPYGDTYHPERCVTEALTSRPSGSRLDCRSDFGIWDTSGNVAEWTADGLLKGGGASAGAFESRCSARLNPDTDELPPHVGVRCCLDAQMEYQEP